MKSIFFSMSVALILTLFSCQDNSKQARAQSTMTLQSTGEVTVEPDEANISLNLECVDKDINKSRDCLIKMSKDLNELLRKKGVKDKDIMTTNINLSKKYQWVNNSQVFIGYEASVNTRVTIRDLNILGPLYTALLTNERVNVGGLTYTHSKMDSLHNAAYVRALQKSNTLADQLLAETGKSTKVIVHISNGSTSSVRPQYEMARNFKFEEAEAAGNVEINLGTIKVSKTLQVEYIFN